MAEVLINSLIQSLPQLVTSIATLIVAIKAHKQLKIVHGQINSRMDQLLEITAKSSKAEGVKIEKERVK